MGTAVMASPAWRNIDAHPTNGETYTPLLASMQLCNMHGRLMSYLLQQQVTRVSAMQSFGNCLCCTNGVFGISHSYHVFFGDLELQAPTCSSWLRV